MDLPSKNVGNWTTVTLKSGLTREGFFYTMDPDSKSMILCTDDHAFVLLGHSIQHYQFDETTMLNVEEMEKRLHCQQDHMPTNHELSERKNGLIDYMGKHRIPITHSADDPVIVVLGCTRVEPPYVSTSTSGNNVILLKRVRDLITQYNQTVE